jgi:excisionase family DNA binding protein
VGRRRRAMSHPVISGRLQGKPTVTTPISLDSALLTCDEAAELLRCSRRTIERRVASGEITATRNGRRVLIPLTAIRAFVASNVYRGSIARAKTGLRHGAVVRHLWD